MQIVNSLGTKQRCYIRTYIHLCYILLEHPKHMHCECIFCICLEHDAHIVFLVSICLFGVFLSIWRPAYTVTLSLVFIPLDCTVISELNIRGGIVPDTEIAGQAISYNIHYITAGIVLTIYSDRRLRLGLSIVTSDRAI